jgi:ATP-dependent helicase/nuclease subunit A
VPTGDEGGDSRPAGALDPLGLGTLVHAVVDELAAGKDDSRSEIESLVRKHAGIHLPNVGDGLDEATNLISGLTHTPRWASVRRASCIHSELEFLLAWPPEGAEPGGPFIQGFIDCLYQDSDGQWRLLDYKTNRVSPETLSAVVEGYEMQMLAYALAVERVLKRPPAEIVLHFLRDNIEHQFAWNDAVRARAVELINAGVTGAIEAGL